MKKIISTIIFLCIPIIMFSQTAQDYNNSANRKHSQKDYYGAIIDFNKAIILDSKLNDIYANRGYSKFEISDFKGAVLDFSKAIEIKTKYRPNFGCGVEYEMRADCKLELGDYRGAILDYTKSNDLYPHPYPSRDILVKRGLAKINIGDTVGACLDFSIAGERGHSKAYFLIKQYCN